MFGEIGAMTVDAGTTTVIAWRQATTRHEDGLAKAVDEASPQRSTAQVTGSAGVMDLVVQDTPRHPIGVASGGGMAG